MSYTTLQTNTPASKIVELLEMLEIFELLECSNIFEGWDNLANLDAKMVAGIFQRKPQRKLHESRSFLMT